VLRTLCFSLLSLSSFAGVVLYEGRDAGVGPGEARPNSDAARDAFLAALGVLPAFTLTFEDVPLGYALVLNFTTFTVTQVGTEPTAGPEPSGVTDSFPDNIIGYNTTPGGKNFLRFTPTWNIGTAGARLTFKTPIEYFGAYFTGLGTAAGSLNAKFNDGSGDLSFPIKGGSGGGVQFFGFTTFGAPITQMDLVLEGVYGTRDIYAMDDVITGLRATYVPDVPEPSTYGLAGAALAALAFLRRRCAGCA
jgi:hypothetical protein